MNKSIQTLCLSLLTSMMIFVLPCCGDDDDPEGTGNPGGDTGSDNDTETEPQSTETEPTGETVDVTVHLVDAMSNGGISGAQVLYGDAVEFTDTNGNATHHIAASSKFEMVAGADNYQTYHLYGMSGESDFVLTSFGSSQAVTESMLGALSLSYDDTKAIVVVGLDTITLAPAVGAGASIDAAHDPSFIFEGSVPKAGDTIVAGGMSMVTFPNVTPGPVEITVTAPDGQTCHAFPGPTDLTSVTAYANEVTVISYTCK